MPSTHIPRILSAITIIPIALMLFTPVWSKACMEPIVNEYTKLADKAEQEMELLAERFDETQIIYNFIETQEYKPMFPSIVDQHRSTGYTSSPERFEMATARNAILRTRTDALRKTIHEHIGNKAVFITLSDQKAKLIENGIVLKEFTISSGSPGTPTPIGQFMAYRKQDLRISNQDPPYRMPYYISFTKNGSHGLHALPYLGKGPSSSDYWHEALDHIGKPVSHGCVRFLPEDAKEIYEWITLETPILIGV